MTSTRGMVFSKIANLKKKWPLLAATGVAWLAVACGDTFRPVATPITQPGGDPRAQRNAIVLSANDPNPGTTNHLDVSGDTSVAVHQVGLHPVHGVVTALSTFIANRDGDSITAYQTFAGGASSNVVITLPTGARPVFLNTREGGTLYAATNGSDANCGGVHGTLAVISMTTLSLTTQVCAGASPVAVAELPNASKIYVANQGSNDVTVINVVDKSVAVASLPVGVSPSWIDASPDSAYVFVSNQGSNTVSVISTATDTVLQNVAVGAGPTFLKFDAHLRRVYVANSAGDSVSVINADPNTSTFLSVTTVSLPAGASPSSVAPLADGTRVYVANKGLNSVSVISTSSNAVTGAPIPVGAAPVSIDAVSDSSKVYTANSASGSISVIRTVDNTLVMTAPSASPQPTWVMVTP